ncbi:antitoxin [Mycoavidus sp. SF9855]|uniref:antitoxin n=1 Tax=Mycoavidus sp. SF9855 TaxID=2968475 RepID=UPI00211C638F|nr:AbrB/MazE/SpoVT family DNA-binding domain-containing protein [Mycoavidus sp. SF9855]UUM21292.1 AbrB/MazE/SpoVT family DNA-binding domain-containing protein [Mycoavidus sp. SF9855]
MNILLEIEFKEPNMLNVRSAKLFQNGASQAVRLPAEFRFEGNEVYITRDEVTGDVTLSNRPGAKTWKDFRDLMHSIDVPTDFMEERPMNVMPQERNLFEDAAT